MDFSIRSNKSELIDRDDLSFDEISSNMQELDSINSLLGGHRITIKGVQLLIKEKRDANQPLIICEIGCGGGDNIAALFKWFKKRKTAVSFIGIDINPYCIQYAAQRNPSSHVTFICSDYRNVVFERPPDIIFSSLFCHHFSLPRLIEMMKWLNDHSGTGFFINDLHRHPMAYYSIRFLTALFSKSRLVKNDAPLSVLRGFRKNEWHALMQESNIFHYSLQWMWAFRWLLVAKKKLVAS